MPDFYMGAEDSNSDPHAYTAHTLLTEPSHVSPISAHYYYYLLFCVDFIHVHNAL